MTDFYFIDGGSVIMLIPHSDQAKEWTAANIELQAWQNPERIACEVRYFNDISEAISAEGMTIQALN